MNELTLGVRRALLTAGIAGGLLALSTAGASAAIACRGDVCWRVHTAYAMRRAMLGRAWPPPLEKAQGCARRVPKAAAQ